MLLQVISLILITGSLLLHKILRAKLASENDASVLIIFARYFFQDGWSALMTACSKGYPQVVEVLLHGGAHPDLQSKVRRQYRSNAFG